MLDPRIILSGQQQADPFETAAKGIQFGQGLRQLLSGRQAGKMQQLASPEERQAFANKSMFSRELNTQIKADALAQEQKALALQKHNADIEKTQSETSQNNAATQGKNLTNAQTLLTSANQALYVATQSGDANAVKLALNNAKTAGALDEATYNQYFATAEGLSTNPEGLKSFALNLQKAYAQNPEKYNFTTADNVLDNQTAVDNNIRTNQTSENNSIRTAETSRYSTDVNAQTAANKLSVEQAKIELEQKKGTVQQFGDGLYMVYPNGSAVPINSPTGQPITKVANQKAINEENKRIQRVETLTPEIKSLLTGGATGSYFGAGLDLLGRTVGISTDGAEATAQLKTLSGQLVALMPRMEGPQSNIDVEMYKEMAGNVADPTIPIQTRLAALDTIEKLNQKYKGLNSGGIPASIAKPSGNTQPLSSAQNQGFQSLLEKHTK